jgi:pyruvate-formate lyase
MEERKEGVLDVSQIPSSIAAHGFGYFECDNEIIVGLRTEAPLKRAIMPNGGFRMILRALMAHGYGPDPHVPEAFTKYRLQPRPGARAQPHRLVLAEARGHVPTFSAKVAIDTSSIQFESDEIMHRSGATTARSPAASRRCGSASRPLDARVR